MAFWNKKDKKEKRMKLPALETGVVKREEASPVKNAPQDKTGRAARVLVHPLLTEKGTMLEKFHQYLFNVYPEATKPEIKKAIKQLYGVNVEGVNVLKMRGKKVSFGRHVGVQKNWKKAIVTLKAGEQIEVYKK